MSPRLIFPDTSVGVNFAVIGKISLLVGWLRDRGAMCDAVWLEMVDNTKNLPEIGALVDSLSDAIELTSNEERRAEQVRLNSFGGSAAKPRQHLGEAHTLTLMINRPEYRDSTWLSDDGDSRAYARQQGIQTLSSVDVLGAMTSDGDLTTRQAWGLWLEMFDHPRGGCERPTSEGDFALRASR